MTNLLEYAMIFAYLVVNFLVREDGGWESGGKGEEL
jgi:hypothetical protein